MEAVALFMMKKYQKIPGTMYGTKWMLLYQLIFLVLLYKSFQLFWMLIREVFRLVAQNLNST